MKTLTLTEFENIYNVPKKLIKFIFDSIQPSLILGVDYIKDRNSIKLSLSGCLFIADKLHGFTNNMEAARKIIHILTQEEIEDEKPTSEPFEIIEEQLKILKEKVHSMSNDVQETIELIEDNKTTEEKRKENYKKQQASNNEIKEKVSSPEDEEWRKKMSELVREIANKQKTTFSNTIRSIYIKMRNRYGFVSEQCIKDYMNKYKLQLKPSTLSAISDDETWKSVFECIAENMLNEIESKND